ncbi:MAG: acetolactate synthase small subunit [Rhodothermales bacterium]
MAAESLTAQQLRRRKAAGEPIELGDSGSSHQHTITVLVENTIGAMIRVVNMFSARGFNLESVAVGETDDPSMSRMNIVTTGNDRVIAQILRQLNRLVDTLEVSDLTDQAFVERELCLLKVSYKTSTRAEIMDINTIFRGKVVDITLGTMTFEVTGPVAKVDAFVNLMRPHGIVEVARSGRVAMCRAEQKVASETK